MTYDLTIGERYEEQDEFENGRGVLETVTIVGAKFLELEQAPEFPGSFMSKKRNAISISVFGLAAFKNAIAHHDPELAELLIGQGWNDRRLIPITAELVVQIVTLVEAYRILHPEAVPQFDTEHDPDWILARLEVLRWWSVYALDTFGSNAVIAIS